MTLPKCPWHTLGVRRDASSNEIQAAFRRLALKYHPDVNGGDATMTARFRAASEAYEEIKRLENDNVRRTSENKRRESYRSGMRRGGMEFRGVRAEEMKMRRSGGGGKMGGLMGMIGMVGIVMGVIGGVEMIRGWMTREKGMEELKEETSRRKEMGKYAKRIKRKKGECDDQ